ncbi:MAG: hypothetical protein JST40_08770 [Armatimonadetes bacterium]|nr:hypothetical protein [Armatimonadota bacterium]
MSASGDGQKRVSAGLPRIVWGLLAAIVMSAVFVYFSKEESELLPSATNNLPSGTMAFAELLRESGYEVSIIDSHSQKVGTDALAIVFVPMSSSTPFGPSTVENQPAMDSVDRMLKTRADSGGNVLLLGFPVEFDEESKASSAPILLKSNSIEPDNNLSLLGPTSGFPTLLREISSEDELDEFVEEETNQGYLLWVPVLDNQFYDWRITSEPYKKSSVFRFSGGALFSNRFIDQADNGRLARTLVQQAAMGRKKVLFVETGLGNASGASLWQTLGPYASAAYLQFLLLLGVVLWTSSRRFGPPVEETITIRGSRELVDGFGDLLARGKHTGMALQLLYENLDLRVRRAINLPATGEERDRDDRISSELAQSLRSLKVDQTNIDRAEALKRARAAIFLVEELERNRRGRLIGIPRG